MIRVLLAEDHGDIRMAVTRLLELAGATVDSVSDGDEAVVKARAGTFDIVLMDLRMPRMSGLAATRVLRGEGNRTPVLALTADAATTRRTEALEAGCDECLSKPFTLNELVECIQRIPRRSRRRTIMSQST